MQRKISTFLRHISVGQSIWAFLHTSNNTLHNNLRSESYSLSSIELNLISSNRAKKSPSLTLSISESGIHIRLSVNKRCRGLIFRSRLKEKYCGKSLSSERSLPISWRKNSTLGLKLFSMLKVSKPGERSTMLRVSRWENPRPRRYSSLGMKVSSTLETRRTVVRQVMRWRPTKPRRWRKLSAGRSRSGTLETRRRGQRATALRMSGKGISTGPRRKRKTGMRSALVSQVRRDGYMANTREASAWRRPKDRRASTEERMAERGAERREGLRQRAREESRPRSCSIKRSFSLKRRPASEEDPGESRRVGGSGCRYCLDKLPSQHEVISWSCEQCKPRPSMVKPNQCGTMEHLKCQFKQTKRSASMQNIGKRHENNAGFSQSSLMRFEKHSKNKRRKLILLENESAEATKEKLLEVKMPKNLSRPRGRLISDGGCLDEEIHANSPVKNSCQLLALSQVEIEQTIQNTFLPSDLSVQLLGCPVWRGCFDVCNEEFGPLKACMSIKACEKVCNIVTKLPPVLQMTKLSRNEWPTSFNNSPPNDDSIALCFFSENSNAGAALNNLLDRITMKDLALRVVLDEAEMLVFSSIILPEYCQRFEARYYLWGAFRGRQDNSEPCAPTNNCLDSNKVLTIRHFPPGFRHATEQCDNAEKIKTRDFPPGFRHATEQCDNVEKIKTIDFPPEFRHATEQCDNAENCNILEQLVDKSKNSKSQDCSESACSENQVNIDINLHRHPVQICPKPTADEKMSQNSNLEHASDSERREYNGNACSKSQVNINSNMHHSDVPICSHPTAEGISWNRNFEHASDSKRPEYNGSACSESRVNINSNMHHHPEQICPNPCDEGRTSRNRIIVHASDSKSLDSENQININSNMDHLPMQICPNPPAEERTSGNRNFEHASDSKRQNYDGSACSKSEVNIRPNIHQQTSPIYTNPTAEERMSQNRNFERASDSKRLEYNGSACSESQVNINLNMHPHPVQVCPNPSSEQSTPQNRNFAHDSNMHHHPVQICPNPTTEERMSQNKNIVCASENCYDCITDDCRTVKQLLANNSNSLEERVVQCLDGNPFSEISDDSSAEITKDRKVPMLDSLEYQGKHDQPNNAMHKHPSTGKMPQQGKELLNLRMTKNPVACILDAHKLLGFNYLDWLRNLKIVLDFEKLTYVLEHSPPAGVNDDTTEEEKITLQKWRDDDLKAKYYIISSMSDELQKRYKNISHAYEIHAHLDKLYGAKSRIRRYRILRDLIQTRMIEGSSVHDHVLKMINMVEKLENLGIGMDNNLYIDLILQSLPESFSQFINNFLKNGIETSLRGLLNMLNNAELTIKGEASDMLKGSSKPKDVEENFQTKKSHKTKTEIRMAKPQVLSEVKCFHCGKLGHLKRNCKQLLTKLNKEKSRFR